MEKDQVKILGDKMVKYQVKFLGKNGQGPGKNLGCKLVKHQV